jgi:DNA-binding transcriptional MerR regulator
LLAPVKNRLPENQTAEKSSASAKLVYRIEEVSRISGVPVQTLEIWENELPFLNSGLTSGGRKIFRRKDLDIILRIKALLEEKSLTLAGVKRKIEEEFGLTPSAPVHPEKLRKALCLLREELQSIAAALEKKTKTG